MKKRMMLIDGSSLIHRAFYALPLLTNKDGIYTNGVYGFLTMFNRLMEEYDPDYLAVAFDRSGPTFRHKDYEAYKANRSKTPSELASQFGILKDLLQSMRVTTLDLSEYEADDICGTLAEEAKKQGMEVFLVTGDKDYFQLVDEDVTVLLTRKGISETERFTPEKINEDYGIEPKQFIEVKGLMGDSSDNIPGVPGIGEKRALQYIQEYGNLENLYDNVEEISGPKTRQSLIDNQSTAFLSRKLGEIFLQAPVDLDLEKYRRLEPDNEELNRKLDRLDMRSLMTKKDSGTEGKSVNLKRTSVQGIKGDILKKQTFSYLFFFDNDYILSDPSHIVVATDEFYCVMTAEEAEVLFPLFEDGEIKKITYDVKESYCTFLRRGLEINNYEDVMILAYLVDPGQDGTLQRLASKHGYDLAKEEEILGKGKSKKTWTDVDKEEQNLWYSNYLAILPKLNETLLNTVVEREMMHLYHDVELPLAKVLAHMEYEGFCINQDILNQLGEEFNTRLQEIEDEIYTLAGEEFNINSPKQLSEILFEKLNLPVIKKTKTGYSTNVDVLNKLKDKHPIINHILEYRTLAKLVSTYIDGLGDEIQKDGKIHSHFRQTITATGRISSTEPNLQNIPVKTEEGRRIRKAFVAPEGMELLDGDYSQIELRVLAHLAQDEMMLSAFEEGLDIHAKTAAEVFHVDVDEVTPLMRNRAKAVNFGIVYGISDYGLSQDLDITRKEAKQYIDKYLDTYPSIKSYMHDIVEIGKKNGYVETILNRRRYIPELKSRNFNIRSFGERVALNTPIQGSAADIIKIAMVRVFNALEEKKMKSKLILQVHDELILQVPEDEKEEVEALLLKEMENAVQLSVRLKVDSSWGKSWYEAK